MAAGSRQPETKKRCRGDLHACSASTQPKCRFHLRSGGEAYDSISENVADGIAHVVNRVWPTPGERSLDIATGTGWSARRLAARGALVIGIDIGEGVIEAAKRLGPGITFQVGDADGLEFNDSSFDGVTSTFGVMSAPRSRLRKWLG